MSATSIEVNVVEHQEYRIEGGAWQTSGLFDGLDPNTTYLITTRIKGSDTHYVSDESEALSVSTMKVKYLVAYRVVGSGGSLLAKLNDLMINTGSMIEKNQSILFTATPTAKHQIYRWLVNGEEILGKNKDFVIERLSFAIDVSVEFVLEGDINGDESVSITDLINLRRYLAGLSTLNPKGKAAADLDGNGIVTITDLIRLRRRLAGLE